MNIKFFNVKNYLLEPISYYMKTFDHTYPGMGMHNHPYFEIMYVAEGSFFLDIFDEKQSHYDKNQAQDFKRFSIKKGQFIVLDSHVYHRLLLDENQYAFVYNVEFLPKTPNKYNPYGVNAIMQLDYSTLFLQTNFKHITYNPTGYTIVTDTHNVESAFKKLLRLLTNQIHSIENACAVFSAQLLLFTEISKCLSFNNASSSLHIRKAIICIQENFHHGDFSVDDVTNHVGISKAYLQRQFKIQTGMTILEYINNLRIQKATELLVNTSMMIKDIALKVGFKSKNQMLYEFKRIMKTTPQKHKNMYNKSKIDHHYGKYDSYSLPQFDHESFHTNIPTEDSDDNG